MYINNTAVIGGSIKDASRKSSFVDSGLVGKTSENSLYRNFYQNTFNIDVEKKISIIILYFIQSMMSFILICITRYSKSEGVNGSCKVQSAGRCTFISGILKYRNMHVRSMKYLINVF